jgi:hypothetical protein
MAVVEFLRSERWLAISTLGALLLAFGLWRAEALPGPLGDVVADMANSGPSQRDIDVQVQNYYAVLMDVGDQDRWAVGRLADLAVWLLRRERTTEAAGNWVMVKRSNLVVTHPEAFLDYELKPSFETIYMGVPVKTNRWQMRDREYELAKPPGTFRIAIVGSSNDMGYGVRVEESYPDLLEERLNAELAGRGFDRYEVLNFSVGGYELLHRLYVADEKVPPFDPDVILVVATMHDLRWQVYELLVTRVHNGLDLHYDFLRRFAAQAGVEPGQSLTRIRQKLRPRREALVRATFEELRKIGEREGVPMVLVNFRLRVDPIHPEMIRQTELARQAGLETLEVFDAYEGQSDKEMYLTPTDSHPTVKAHALLADELYEDMLAVAGIRSLLLGSAGPKPEDAHDDRRADHQGPDPGPRPARVPAR